MLSTAKVVSTAAPVQPRASARTIVRIIGVLNVVAGFKVLTVLPGNGRPPGRALRVTAQPQAVFAKQLALQHLAKSCPTARLKTLNEQDGYLACVSIVVKALGRIILLLFTSAVLFCIVVVCSWIITLIRHPEDKPQMLQTALTGTVVCSLLGCALIAAWVAYLRKH